MRLKTRWLAVLSVVVVMAENHTMVDFLVGSSGSVTAVFGVLYRREGVVRWWSVEREEEAVAFLTHKCSLTVTGRP